jgi:ribosomal-protein-alanine acetyltransferase
LRIRLAIFADIPSILALERQSASAGHWTEEQYRRALGRKGPERLVLVAEEESTILSGREAGQDSRLACLGFLVARHVAPEWELENIVVSASARRKGIGRRLLDGLLAAVRETNSEWLLLEVRESNAPAREFYEKAGFEQTGRRKLYYAEPSEDAVLYGRRG